MSVAIFAAAAARPVIVPQVAVSEPTVSHPLAIPQVHDDVAVTPRASIAPVMAPRTTTETASDQPETPHGDFKMETPLVGFFAVILLAGFVAGCAFDAVGNDYTTRRTRICAGAIGAVTAFLVVCTAVFVFNHLR